MQGPDAPLRKDLLSTLGSQSLDRLQLSAPLGPYLHLSYISKGHILPRSLHSVVFKAGSIKDWKYHLHVGFLTSSLHPRAPCGIGSGFSGLWMQLDSFPCQIQILTPSFHKCGSLLNIRQAPSQNRPLEGPTCKIKAHRSKNMFPKS